MASETPKPAPRTRRSFVQTVAAGGATAASGLWSSQATAARPPVRLPPSRVIGANDRIVVAYVGTGNQGMTHVKLGKAGAQKNNIVQAAVCDVYDKRLGTAQKFLELPDSAATRDHRRIMDNKDIDAVFVSTVDHWHADVGIDALQAGKHVYGEKPMARYLEEGFRLYDTAKETRRVFQIGSQYCADEHYHKAAEWIKAGRIGPLVSAQGSYCRNHAKNSEWTYPIDLEAGAENLDWKRWLGRTANLPFTPEHYFSWHKFYAYNSGILGNLLSHIFLPLLLATGETELPRLVTCTGTRKVSTDREITDSTYLLAEMPDGLTFQISGSTVNEQGLAPMIRGLKGTIYLPISETRATMKPERPYAEESDVEEFTLPTTPASVAKLESNFFDCIRSGADPVGNVDLALRAHVILCMAEMSQRLGVTLLFDPKSRTLRTADGRVVKPLSYGNRAPVPKPISA